MHPSRRFSGGPAKRGAPGRVSPTPPIAGQLPAGPLECKYTLVRTVAWLLLTNSKLRVAFPNSFTIAFLKSPSSFAQLLRLVGDFNLERYSTQWASSIRLKGRRR
jgi:hypothetical protein